MQDIGPNPNKLYPLDGDQNLVFLKNLVTAPNILIGDYTYFDDRMSDPKRFETYNVLYNYIPDKVKLVIGKFCAIAMETRFIMTGDHKLDAISTYPFPIFQKGWEVAFDPSEFKIKGDIIIGNDVWFGFGSTIKNGVTIGDGAIIAANAMVVKDVPPYSIVAGNPGKIVKMRFSQETIERLLKISWWNWPIEKINKNLKLLCTLDVDALEQKI